jgi:hypothetical protein
MAGSVGEAETKECIRSVFDNALSLPPGGAIVLVLEGFQYVSYLRKLHIRKYFQGSKYTLAIFPNATEKLTFATNKTYR